MLEGNVKQYECETTIKLMKVIDTDGICSMAGVLQYIVFKRQRLINSKTVKWYSYCLKASYIIGNTHVAQLYLLHT